MHRLCSWWQWIDKQFITKCITDHVENLVSSLTLLAMNAVLMKLQVRVWFTYESVLDYSSEGLIALPHWDRDLWFCLIMHLISDNEVHFLTCSVLVAGVCLALTYVSFILAVAVKQSEGKDICICRALWSRRLHVPPNCWNTG